MNIVLLLCVLGGLQICTGQECGSNGLKRFDVTVAKLLTIGNSGRKFPESKGPELKVFCDQSFEYIIELENIKNKCLKNLPKQVVGVLIFATKNSIKQYCKKDSKKLTELISATPCINTANTEITKCYTKTIDAFIGTKHAKEAKRLPHICCEYYKIYPCFHERTKRYPNCNEKHIESVSDFIRTIFNNMVDLICGEYTENSDKCEKLESAPKKKKNQKRTKSFAVPLIEVLDSFPEI